MKIRTLSAVVLLLALVSGSVAADVPRGPLPPEQQALIDAMATRHGSIVRVVTETPDGYRATTTSEDPIVVQALREHLRYMKDRIEAGGRVRGWDPAFREMFAHHADLRTEIRDVEGGVEVQVRGLTPAAVEVARNHGRIVSRFVEEGHPAVRRSHPVALPAGAEASSSHGDAP